MYIATTGIQHSET